MWEILLLSLKLGDTPVFMTACLPYTGLSVSQGTPKVNAKTLRYQTGKMSSFPIPRCVYQSKKKNQVGLRGNVGMFQVPARLYHYFIYMDRGAPIFGHGWLFGLEIP